MTKAKKFLTYLRFPILPILVILAFPIISFIINPLLFQSAVYKSLEHEGMLAQIESKSFQMIDFKTNEKTLIVKFKDNPFTYIYTYESFPTRLKVSIVDAHDVPINSYLFGGTGAYENYSPNEDNIKKYLIYEKDDFVEGSDNFRLK